MLALLAALALAAPQPVTEIRRADVGFELYHRGKPYWIQGAGADDELESLREAGGNSVRTWGMDADTGELLDRAHALGLTVTLGYWMRKDEGFDYKSEAHKREQAEELRKWVRTYRDHPAVLIWAVGNEQELGTPWPEVFIQTNRLAQIVKEEDPTRPVMSVLADMWPEKAGNIERHLTSVDLLGINSYGGLGTLHERMEFWKKPYIVSEFQTLASQDVPKTPWGTPIEPSSAHKARDLRALYASAIRARKGRVLGSYFFYWGRSGSGTASWWTPFLATGERLASYETLREIWSGRRPPNRSPILTLTENEPVSVNPTGDVRIHANASDPDGDGVSIRYEVLSDDPSARFQGDFEMAMSAFGSGSLASGIPMAIKAPDRPGPYRVLVIATDGKGAAAVDFIYFSVKTN